MEDFVVNGGIRVPIGYRFLPTDEELVDYYLKRKVLGLPLPASVIPDQLDLFNTDPWSLPGDLEKKRYFFGKRSGDIIWSGSGYWKCNGKTKQIHVDSGGQSKAAAVGRRTTLVFQQGKRARTGWFMREYRLVPGINTTTNTNSTIPCEMGFGDWAVYCVFQRKKKATKKKRGFSVSAVSQHDLSNSNNRDLTCGMVLMNTPNNSIESAIEETDCFTAIQPSVSACLSEVTIETSSNGFDEEVTSSACNTCSR